VRVQLISKLSELPLVVGVGDLTRTIWNESLPRFDPVAPKSVDSVPL
jgi:hypothetical protein